MAAPTGISAFSSTTGSTTALAACPRSYLRVKNEHASNTIAVNFGGTAALATAGNFTILGSAAMEWTHPPGTLVAIIASGSSSPVTIEEW